MNKKGISGSTLKLIACLTMLIDHIAAFLLTRILLSHGYGAIDTLSPEKRALWMEQNTLLMQSIDLMRRIGRLGFPIFAFLLVEGVQKTSNVKKYMERLLLFGILSEIPFDLALSGYVFDWKYQNVYFTLLLGVVTIWAMAEAQKRLAAYPFLPYAAAVGITLCTMTAAEYCQTDYGATGVLAIVVLYLLRKNKLLATAGACLVLTMVYPIEIYAFVILLPIAFYNGKRGLRLKYVFYGFYPIHLLLLWLISWLMGMGAMSTVAF